MFEDRKWVWQTGTAMRELVSVVDVLDVTNHLSRRSSERANFVVYADLTYSILRLGDKSGVVALWQPSVNGVSNNLGFH